MSHPRRRLAATAVLAGLLAAGAPALTGCAHGSSAPDTKAQDSKAQDSKAQDAKTRDASAQAGPRLSVGGGYVPQPPMADMAAGYFTVTNSGGADDRLTSVSSDLAAEVTMHSTQGGEMREVTSFTVPAGGRLVLGTGGNHLMLMGLKRRPAIGDRVSFELHFAKSAPITVRVPVEPPSYRPQG